MRSKSGAVGGPAGGGEGWQSQNSHRCLEVRIRREAAIGHQVSKRKEGRKEKAKEKAESKTKW